MHFFLPTNRENALSRLFFRYFLLYVATLPLALWLSARGLFQLVLLPLPLVALLPVVSAALFAFFTITGPLMVLLTLLKGLLDFSFLLRAVTLAQNQSIGLIHFNAVLLLLGAGIIIYIFSAATARLFAFENQSRDLSLLFSKAFFKYLIKAAIFALLAIVLYYLWQKLLTLLPSLVA